MDLIVPNPKTGFWSRTARSYARLSATWTLEIVAIVFSTLCLAALIGTLAYADGKEVLVWHGVTLNSLVSLLATACKLSALSALGAAIAQSKWILFFSKPRSLLDFEAIDLASRGVFGSLQLMCRGRTIAFMGAIAFVLGIAFDPFTQQLVQYKMEVIYSPNANSTAVRAQRYSSGTQWASQLSSPMTRTRLNKVTAIADFAMQAAVLNGLVPSVDFVEQQSRVGCPTANCTWPAFESLAVCSTCQDLQSKLRKGMTQGPISTALSPDNDGLSVAYITGYNLTNGLFINNPVPDDDMDRYSPGPGPLRMTTLSTAHPAKTLTMQELNALIWSVSMLKVGTSDDPNAGWPDIPVQATECALYYCVKSFEVNITNNQITQNSTEDKSATRSPASWIPLDKLSTNYSVSPADDLNWDPDGSGVSRTDLMLGQDYNISQIAVNGIGALLNDTFAGGEPPQTVDGIEGYYIDKNGTSMYFPPATQALYESDDLNATFEGLATSMTNAIRAGDDNNLIQQGDSGVARTVYRIWWPWISLPLVVLVASVIQLVIIMASSKNVPLWKSSTLATLSRGRMAASALDGADTIEALQDAAGRQRVDLFGRNGIIDDKESAYSSSFVHPTASGVQKSGYTHVSEDAAIPMRPLLRDERV